MNGQIPNSSVMPPQQASSDPQLAALVAMLRRRQVMGQGGAQGGVLERLQQAGRNAMGAPQRVMDGISGMIQPAAAQGSPGGGKAGGQQPDAPSFVASTPSEPTRTPLGSQPIHPSAGAGTAGKGGGQRPPPALSPEVVAAMQGASAAQPSAPPAAAGSPAGGKGGGRPSGGLISQMLYAAQHKGG
jgi:hypothetical protein